MTFRSISRPFPGFSSAHQLSESLKGHPFCADLEITGKQARSITRAEMTLPHPVRARWAMGRRKPGDVIGTTLAVPLLVSERVVQLLQDAGFTGWSTYDVELAGHDGAPIPGYHGLSAHGRCGPIDDNKSIEMPTVYPGGVFPCWHGLFFDPDTWDGSDVFMPEGTMGCIFVLDVVRQAFQKAKIRSVAFTSLTEIRRSHVEMEISRSQRTREPPG